MTAINVAMEMIKIPSVSHTRVTKYAAATPMEQLENLRNREITSPDGQSSPRSSASLLILKQMNPSWTDPLLIFMSFHARINGHN